MRRQRRRLRDITARVVAHDFRDSQRAMLSFCGVDGEPLFGSRCLTCGIPLTYTIKRDGETLCLMEHVQKLVHVATFNA